MHGGVMPLEAVARAENEQTTPVMVRHGLSDAVMAAVAAVVVPGQLAEAMEEQAELLAVVAVLAVGPTMRRLRLAQAEMEQLGR